jgi:multidrug efflux system membrane fusion protein
MPIEELIEEPEIDTKRPRPHRSRKWIWLPLVLVAAYGLWHYRPVAATAAPEGAATGGGRGGRGAGGANAVVSVVAAAATKGSIPLYLRGIGNVTPAATVTLHSRVDGQIVNVHFTEGQFVHKDDLLVEIDPRPYEAALAQAQGQLAHDSALYNDDQVDYQRFQALYDKGLIPKQQLDSQAALVNEFQGAMASDNAAITTAKLNVAYSRVTAPISGRIGLRLVDPGNVVHANDTTGLVIITQVQPIAVLFSLPQENLQKVYGELRAGRHPQVAALDSANAKQLAVGTLLTIDDAIDPATGTFRCKAMFDNADNALFPNQFVNVRMLVGQAGDVTIVPSSAIQRGPQGTYVFVMSPANTVNMRTVTVAVTEGTQVGLSSGLQPGDKVVVDGADRLQEGSRVQTSAPGQGQGQGGQGQGLTQGRGQGRGRGASQ